jgi:uncharacterized protein (TIGR03435 family)
LPIYETLLAIASITLPYMKQQPFIVIGMHRSGTSTLANILHAAGLSAGPVEELSPPSKSNENGYWEHQPLVEFNEKLLGLLQSSWKVPPATDDDVRGLSLDPSLRSTATGLIARMGNHGVDWMWKDPRLSVLLPFWLSLLRNPIFLVPVRDPYDVAHSLHVRDSLPQAAGLLLWQAYMSSILRNIGASQRVIFVKYDRLLAEPDVVIDTIEHFLAKYARFTTNRLLRLAEMKSIIRPDLCHTNSGTRQVDHTVIGHGLPSVWRDLVERCSGLAPAMRTHSAWPGWRGYLKEHENKLLAWETTTIQLNVTYGAGGRINLDTKTDSFRACDFTLRRLIQYAYDFWRPDLILGLPEWAKTTRYNVEATVGSSEISAFHDLSAIDRRLMLQSLLRHRFGLKLSRVIKYIQVYGLISERAVLPMKMGPAYASETFRTTSGKWIARRSDLRNLVIALAQVVRDRPIVDMTSLTSKYDFTLRFDPTKPLDLWTDRLRQPFTSVSTKPGEPSLVEALWEQLGLKLIKQRGRVDYLAIDEIDAPQLGTIGAVGTTALGNKASDPSS